MSEADRSRGPDRRTANLLGIAQLAEIERRSRWSATRLWAHQQRKLAELLKSAWARSAFYRAHLAGHGIGKADLGDVTIRDLPLANKRPLTDHFDDVVTVPGLTRSALEQWFEGNTDPESVYDERLVIVRSSGSAGAPGIFVYDREAWELVHRIASVRFPRAPDGRGARYAFYNVADGRHVGITHARKVATTADHALFLSVLEPLDEAVSSLNDFQPDVLIGYANAVHLLAAEARSGRLRMRPSIVLTSAEPLTDDMERDLVDVWPAVISCVYSRTESVFVAGQRAGEPWMTVMDDACWLEVVDDEGNEVAPGQSGRALLTNLYNLAMPILRYDLQDVVTRGDPALSAPLEQHLPTTRHLGGSPCRVVARVEQVTRIGHDERGLPGEAAPSKPPDATHLDGSPALAWRSGISASRRGWSPRGRVRRRSGRAPSLAAR